MVTSLTSKPASTMYTNPNLTAIDIRIPVLLFLLFTHVHHNVLQIIMLDSMKIAVIYIRFPNTCHKAYICYCVGYKEFRQYLVTKAYSNI